MARLRPDMPPPTIAREKGFEGEVVEAIARESAQDYRFAVRNKDLMGPMPVSRNKVLAGLKWKRTAVTLVLAALRTYIDPLPMTHETTTQIYDGTLVSRSIGRPLRPFPRRSGTKQGAQRFIFCGALADASHLSLCLARCGAHSSTWVSGRSAGWVMWGARKRSGISRRAGVHALFVELPIRPIRSRTKLTASPGHPQCCCPP